MITKLTPLRILPILFLCISLFVACGDDEDGTVTEITISASSETVKPNGRDEVLLTATDQSGNDITENVTFSSGDKVVDSHFTTTELSDYEIVGRYSGIESNTITVSGHLAPSSLSLSLDKTEIKSNGFSFVRLTAEDEEGDDVSEFVTFVNGSEELYTSLFASQSTGTFAIKAKYGDVESAEEEITVTQSNGQNKKVLIEEFTGEWCGWCPQAGYNLDLITKFSNSVITVGIHNGDGYEYSNESGLRQKLGVTFFPDGRISRNFTSGAFNAPTIHSTDFGKIVNDIEKYLEEETMLGIAMNTSVSNDELTVTPMVKFYSDMDEDVYLTIYLLEDRLPSTAQQNYFEGLEGYEESEYYDQEAILSEYAHDHVLRKNLTDAFGDLIPTENVGDGLEYQADDIVIDISEYDKDNVNIVAFVHYDIDNSGKDILNAQKVKAGDNITYSDF